MKKSVLITGIGQTNYIFQLYENITPNLSNSFSFNAINLKTKSQEEIDKANQIFDNNYTLSDKFPLAERLSILIKLIFYKTFWADFILTFFNSNFKIKTLTNVISDHTHAKRLAEYIDGKTNTDIIHNHFPALHTSLFICYLKKDYTFIQTFWGSDIYRMNEIRNIYFQKKLLSRADKITVTTPEMKFSVISKFNAELNKKISEVKFILKEDFYEIADSITIDSIQIKSKLNIPQDKIIIVFGHNATPANNHISFVKAISNSNELNLNDYHFVFPFAYGDNSNVHLNKLSSLCNKYKLSYSILTNYMNAKELVELKSITDLYIHMPTTDGLSAYLTEYFYLNKPCIVASWLPYNTFKNIGINYLECDNFDTLQKKIKEFQSLKTENNKTIVKNTFLKEAIIPLWQKLYNSLNTSD